WGRSLRCCGAGHAIHAYRPRDILEGLLADVLKTEIELAGDLIVHARRDADAAGLGERFEPCRDVDPVAEQVIVLYDDITEIDPNPKMHPAVVGQRVVARLERFLDFYCAAHGFHDARKFVKYRISGGAHDAAAVESNNPVDDGAVRGEHAYRVLFILPHLLAIPDRIRGKDAGQATLDGQWVHALLSRIRPGHSLAGAVASCMDQRKGATPV